MSVTQTSSVAATDLAAFGISRDRGFLPAEDPLQELPSQYGLWEELGRDLPKLLMTQHLRATLERLPALDPAGLTSPAQLERAMLLLSYFAHAYVWGPS